MGVFVQCHFGLLIWDEDPKPDVVASGFLGRGTSTAEMRWLRLHGRFRFTLKPIPSRSSKISGTQDLDRTWMWLEKNRAALFAKKKIQRSLTRACGAMCTSLCKDTTRETRQRRLWMKKQNRPFVAYPGVTT